MFSHFDHLQLVQQFDVSFYREQSISMPCSLYYLQMTIFSTLCNIKINIMSNSFSWKASKKNWSKSTMIFLYIILGTKLAFALFKKTIQYFAQFPKLIREMPLFQNLIISKSSFKNKKNLEPYSGVFKESIVTF